jgi:hypothetical protein
VHSRSEHSEETHHNKAPLAELVLPVAVALAIQSTWMINRETGDVVFARLHFSGLRVNEAVDKGVYEKKVVKMISTGTRNVGIKPGDYS